MSTAQVHHHHSPRPVDLHDIQHHHKEWSKSQEHLKWLGIVGGVLFVCAVIAIFVSMKYAQYGLWAPSSSNWEEDLILKASQGNAITINSNGLYIPAGWGTVIYPAMVEALNGLGPAVITVFGGYNEAGYYASDVVTKVWPGALGAMLRASTPYSDGGFGWVGIGNTEAVGSIVNPEWPNSATHAYYPNSSDWAISSTIGYGPGASFLQSTSQPHLMPLVFTGVGRYVVIYYGSSGNQSPFYVTLSSVANGFSPSSFSSGTSGLGGGSSTINTNTTYGVFYSLVVDAGQYFSSQTVTINAQAGTQVVISGVRFLTSFNMNTSAPEPASGVVVDNYSSGITTSLSTWLYGMSGTLGFWGGPASQGSGPGYTALSYTAGSSHLSIVSMGFADSGCGSSLIGVETNYWDMVTYLQSVTNQDILLVFDLVAFQNLSGIFQTNSSNSAQCTAQTVVTQYQALISYAQQQAVTAGVAVWDVSGFTTNPNALTWTWNSFNNAAFWGNASAFGQPGTNSPYLSDAGQAYMAEFIYDILTGEMSGGVCC